MIFARGLKVLESAVCCSSKRIDSVVSGMTFVWVSLCRAVFLSIGLRDEVALWTMPVMKPLSIASKQDCMAQMWVSTPAMTRLRMPRELRCW